LPKPGSSNRPFLIPGSEIVEAEWKKPWEEDAVDTVMILARCSDPMIAPRRMRTPLRHGAKWGWMVYWLVGNDSCSKNLRGFVEVVDIHKNW
jgi:hypothetical protein